MSKENGFSIIILIVVAVVIFVVGGGAGIFYQTQKDAPQIDKLQVLNVLSSKVIPSIVAYGQVTKIEGRNLTLNQGGDSLTVSIKENAGITSIEMPVAGAENIAPAQQKAEFKDIKKNDNVNVSVKLLPDGSLQGHAVIILPAPVVTNP